MQSPPVRRPRASLRNHLAQLVDGQGPFLSIYLDVSSCESRGDALERLHRRLDQTPGLTESQRNAASRCLLGLHTDDALVVGLIDADGRSITTGYPDPPRYDVVQVADVPLITPLLACEQRLVHHVVAIVENEHVQLMVVPRHGDATESALVASDTQSIPDLIQHTARASATRLVIVGAPAAELPPLQARVRTGLDVAVSLDGIELDGLDLRALASEIVVRTANHAAERTAELLGLWRFHAAHGEATEGLDNVSAAVKDGKAALVLVSESDGLDPAAAEGDRVACEALANDVPVHVVPSVGQTMAQSAGVIVDDRAQPSDLAELLER